MRYLQVQERHASAGEDAMNARLRKQPKTNELDSRCAIFGMCSTAWQHAQSGRETIWPKNYRFNNEVVNKMDQFGRGAREGPGWVQERLCKML